jgi:hypothetical protein
VPERGAGTGFAATEYGTDASPWPLRGSGIVTQARSVAIVQVQSRVVAMLRVPAPPVGVNDVGELLTLIRQRSAVGAVPEVSVDVHADVPSSRKRATVAVEGSRPRTERVPASRMHLHCQSLVPAASGIGRPATGRETENV